jgi:ribonuclease P protein component
VGFVVSKAVGNAVTRNRVKRRLRAILGQRIDAVTGHLVVVRAIPAAGKAEYRNLSADVDRCLAKMTGTAETSACE